MWPVFAEIIAAVPGYEWSDRTRSRVLCVSGKIIYVTSGRP